MLQNDRLKFLHNPLIAYLNIDSFRNKAIDLGERFTSGLFTNQWN